MLSSVHKKRHILLRDITSATMILICHFGDDFPYDFLVHVPPACDVQFVSTAMQCNYFARSADLMYTAIIITQLF